MRHRVVMAAAIVAAGTAVIGTAYAQAAPLIVVAPAVTDPGSLVKVSNGPAATCPPPAGTERPSASVDLYTPGSATPVNRVPYQGPVTGAGTWSVDVRVAADLAPGTYEVQAGCYTDSGLNAGFGPTYARGVLDVRLQDPGVLTLSRGSGRPADTVQVGSGDARCKPPAGSPSPRVRVSLLDTATATRAEAEAPIDATTGRWSLDLRVPDVGPQSATVVAVCLARVGAPSPYARYRPAPFAVEAGPATGPPPATSPATSPTSSPAPGPGPTTTAPPVATILPPGTLPPTPVAVAKVAEPTYTG